MIPKIVKLYFRLTGLIFGLVSSIYMMAFFIVLSTGQRLLIEPDSLNPFEAVLAFIGVVSVGASLFSLLKEAPKSRLYRRIVGGLTWRGS